MKLLLAFIFLHLLAFQVTDQRPTSTVAPVTDETAPDGLYTATTTYNDINMQTTSAEPTVGADQGNTTTNVTGTAGGGSFSNDTVGDEDVKERYPFFHDHPLGTVVVFVLGLIAAVVFLYPVLNQYRKYYGFSRLVRAQEKAYMPPRYQDLMRGIHY